LPAPAGAALRAAEGRLSRSTRFSAHPKAGTRRRGFPTSGGAHATCGGWQPASHQLARPSTGLPHSLPPPRWAVRWNAVGVLGEFPQVHHGH